MKDEKVIDTMVDSTMKSFPLPDDFAELVVRQATSEEDLKRAAEMLSVREPLKSLEDAEKAGLYIVGEEGSVDGTGYFNEIEWSIGSTLLKAVRPGEMGEESTGVPHPAFVKSFRACFKLAKQRGIHLAVVHGSMYDHAFCGFVPCFYYALATLPIERAKAIVTKATMREVRDEKEEGIARDAIARDPYRTKMSASPVRVVEHNGVLGGYITLDRNGYPGNMTLKTREAALAVIKLMGECIEKTGGKEILVMESHMTMLTQTILTFGGKYLLRPSCDVVGLDAEMVAIIDLVGLTQDLKGEFQEHLNASRAYQADSAFSLEMGGSTVGFVVKSGHLEIITEKQEVHRILPRWIVTRLYMGYYSGEYVLAMGPIPYDRSDGKIPDNPGMDMKELHLPENEAMLFKVLFPKLWPCSIPDPDGWPWVIGEDHPRYQHEDLKTPEMKALIDSLRFPWIGY